MLSFLSIQSYQNRVWHVFEAYSVEYVFKIDFELPGGSSYAKATFELLFFSLTIKLRVSFSSGRSRARRHDWISSFWKLLGKRLLYLNCGPSLYSPAPRTTPEPAPTTHSPPPPTPTNHPPPTTTVPTEQAKTEHAWLGSRWILNIYIHFSSTQFHTIITDLCSNGARVRRAVSALVLVACSWRDATARGLCGLRNDDLLKSI